MLTHQLSLDRLVVPRGRPSVRPSVRSSLLNSVAAACWLQQEHEVQLCQECDSSDPLAFLLVSPQSPYCQSEECTSAEMSLAVLNPWAAACTPLLCAHWHHSYNTTGSPLSVSGLHFPQCRGAGRRRSPAAGHVAQGCGGREAVAPSLGRRRLQCRRCWMRRSGG